jgi:[acyl-carrier-protein] S-malonyltransferase
MSEPRIPVVSNSDAILMSTIEGIKAALVKQLSSPVLWEYVIAAMVHAGADTFVEVGPGRVLSGLIKRCATEVRTMNVSDPATLDATLRELSS